MRIVGGRLRGAPLWCPPGDRLRPTADRAREALFNILAPVVEGATFLDLFAGTGAVGYEAHSRGAARVVLVDTDVEALSKNALRLRIRTDGDAVSVIRGGFDAACRRLAGDRFDLIFADPPWKEGMERAILERAAPLLAEDGGLILESWVKVDPPREAEGLTVDDVRRYGDTKFTFYRRTG
ncbi:MAG: 16S rRNA (guanine(966)-N(2))-methyltransferase RsmD [Nitrospinae bacterium]|nr:16S rRNA (guanine(966)-N(2))-methyltransferase RsmD [Nitrospinota bacterium]